MNLNVLAQSHHMIIRTFILTWVNPTRYFAYIALRYTASIRAWAHAKQIQHLATIVIPISRFERHNATHSLTRSQAIARQRARIHNFHCGVSVGAAPSLRPWSSRGAHDSRGKCASDPKLLAELIRKRAPNVKRVVFETGPLSVWFYHAPIGEGLPAIRIDVRHASKALDMTPSQSERAR